MLMNNRLKDLWFYANNLNIVRMVFGNFQWIVEIELQVNVLFSDVLELDIKFDLILWNDLKVVDFSEFIE